MPRQIPRPTNRLTVPLDINSFIFSEEIAERDNFTLIEGHWGTVGIANCPSDKDKPADSERIVNQWVPVGAYNDTVAYTLTESHRSRKIVPWAMRCMIAGLSAGR